jgi:hypothetical protein
VNWRLPDAAARPLHDDELQAAKDILVARAASAAATSPDRISAQLAVASGELIPAFHVSVVGLLELRSTKLEPVTRPYVDGMALPPSPQPAKEPFDVWSVPFAFPGGPPRKDFVPIPSTFEKKDCTACYGKGAAPCKACFSKGSVNCEACMGAGAQPCAICKGLGKISCPDCEGSGRIKSGGMTNKVLGPCGSCNGMGRFPCNHCVEGKVDCGACGNAGKRPCPSCEGKGRMECKSCGGSSKVVVGMGFQVEFRPQQAQESFLAVPGPTAAQEMALSRRAAPATHEFSSEEECLRSLSEPGTPRELQEAAERLLARLKTANTAARLGGLKLSVALGGAWRVAGVFSGHDFVYWIHPSSKAVVAERDPMKEVSRESSESARVAAGRGDWETALDAARNTLDLDPQDPAARALASRWRSQVLRESLLMGVAAGAAGALSAVIPIFAAAKGLNRTGPAAWSGAASLAVGLLAAWVILPVARRLFQTKKRRIIVGSSCAGAVAVFFLVTKAVFGWDAVRIADQSALADEMKAKFKYGVSAVYDEPALQSLQALSEKYKASKADLQELNGYLQAQLMLKKERETLTQEFLAKLDEVVYSDIFLTDKKARVVELKDHYALHGVDTTPADEALKSFDKQTVRRPASVRGASSGRISITPIRPLHSKAATRRPAVKARSTKKKPAAPKVSKPVKKKKRIQPNLEPEPGEKKTSPTRGRTIVN